MSYENNSAGLKLGEVSVKDPAAVWLPLSCCWRNKRTSSVSWWTWWKFPVCTQQVPFVLLVALMPSSSSWTYDHHKLARACMCMCMCVFSAQGEVIWQIASAMKAHAKHRLFSSLLLDENTRSLVFDGVYIFIVCIVRRFTYKTERKTNRKAATL